MNARHRDRMAFFRICSGKFEKGWKFIIIKVRKNQIKSVKTINGR